MGRSLDRRSSDDRRYRDDRRVPAIDRLADAGHGEDRSDRDDGIARTDHDGMGALQRIEHGVEHRYEEFDGTHAGIDYRMDQSLPYLIKALR